MALQLRGPRVGPQAALDHFGLSRIPVAGVSHATSQRSSTNNVASGAGEERLWPWPLARRTYFLSSEECARSVAMPRQGLFGGPVQCSANSASKIRSAHL